MSDDAKKILIIGTEPCLTKAYLMLQEAIHNSPIAVTFAIKPEDTIVPAIADENLPAVTNALIEKLELQDYSRKEQRELRYGKHDAWKSRRELKGKIRRR